MESRYDIHVVGMRAEKYIGVTAGDDEWEKNTEPCNDEKYILFCIVRLPYKQCRKYTITLSTKEGWCYSGYTTASWGYMDIKEVDDFGPATHRPKDKLPIKIENAYFDQNRGLCFEKKLKDEEDEYSDEMYEMTDGNGYSEADVINNVFSYSNIGGDEYYPSGWIHVNMDLFTEHKRAFQERPVWIFSGESATGKSTLAYYLRKDKEVFETDKLKEGEKLPELIWADIVVLGNKNKITVEDIASHLPKGTEVITVNFFKGYLNE